MAASRVEIPLLTPDDPDERARRLRHFLRHVRDEPGVSFAEIDDSGAQPVLRAALDRRSVAIAGLERLARHAGLEFRERWANLVLAVDGMVSAQSAMAIESALAGLPGVHATASFPSRTIRLEFDRSRCQLPEIAMRVAALGFRLAPTAASVDRDVEPLVAMRLVEKRLSRWWRWLASLGPLAPAVGGAALLAAGFIAERGGAPGWASLALYLGAYAVAGWSTARDTVVSLLRLQFNIDVLMFVAAIGAGLLGHFAEGALLLVLFAFGHAGESLAMDRARRAIQALAEVAPETAVIRDPTGATRTVNVDELVVGDIALVRPGERVPTDGEVVKGYTSVDESAITGEPTPAEKAVGSAVFAGTMNGDGAVEVRVAKVSSETTLAKAIRLVEEAQTRRSPTEVLAARVERFYVPIVLIATAFLLLGMPLLHGGDWEHWRTWFYRGMAFLTAASPCAMAISTPAASLAALARAARMGVLIKGGVHLEALGRLKAAAFDKTGTLTMGRPRVVGVTPMGGWTEASALAVAAGIESGSAHPLAAAIVDAARAAGWDGAHADTVEQVVGKGLRGTIAGRSVEVGSPKLFEDDPRAAPLRDAARAHAADGETVAIVRVDGEYAAIIRLADSIRPAAERLVESLRAQGVTQVVMVTGDSEGAALAVGRRLGIDEVHASLLPEDKLRVLGELRARYGVVAMLGDGVNDAPALAAASVGVAMGAAGSDVALETADVALLHDDLTKFPETVRLAKFARRIVTQNLVIALGVIVVLAPLAALGYARIGWAVLFHEGSTVVVVLNALRLLGFRPVQARRERPTAAGDASRPAPARAA